MMTEKKIKAFNISPIPTRVVENNVMSNEKEFSHKEKKSRKNDKEVRKYVSALGEYLLSLWCVKKGKEKREKKKDNHRQIKG
jgi:hypothetical protein